LGRYPPRPILKIHVLVIAADRKVDDRMTERKGPIKAP